MTIPVWVEQQNGTYTASLVGATNVRATGPTKDAAVVALRAELAARESSGELAFIDIPGDDWLGLAEKYKDDPLWGETWREIKEEAYRARDAEKAQEFPE